MGKSEVALILAGGRGKRMGILCNTRPKPILPFAGQFRVIDFTLSNCIHSRITEIAILGDYQREQLVDYLRHWHVVNGDVASFNILPPKIDSYAGTADAVFQNLDYLENIDNDTVLVLAGDHIYKMDYRKMMDFHHMMKADVTLGVVRVPIEETGRFGTVTIDAVNRVTGFVEKSSRPGSNLASMGIYVFNKERLIRRLNEDARESGSPHDFGYAVLPRMVKNDRVFAYEFNGYWHDIGTVEAYHAANMELIQTAPRFSLDGDWPILGDDCILPVPMTNKEGNIVNSLISPRCTIKGRVENSVLSPGVHVAERAVVKDSVIMAGVSIGYHSVVNSCILDEGTTIGRFCYAGFGATVLLGNSEITVIGKDITVPDFTFIGRNCSVSSGLAPNTLGPRLVPSNTNLYI